MGKLTPKQTEELREAFRLIDANNDGVVAPDELKRYVEQVTGDVLDDETFRNEFGISDLDRDGVINFEEFIKVAGEPQSPARQGNQG